MPNKIKNLLSLPIKENPLEKVQVKIVYFTNIFFLIGLATYFLYIITLYDVVRILLSLVFLTIFVSSLMLLNNGNSKLSAIILIYSTWIVALFAGFFSENPSEFLTIFILIIALGFFALDTFSGYIITFGTIFLLSSYLILTNYAILDFPTYFGLINDFMVILIFGVISICSALVFSLTKKILVTEIQHSQQLVNELNVAQTIAKIGNWELDLQTETITWSDQLYDILGFNRSVQPDFKLFTEIVHLDDLEEVNEAIENAVKKDEELSIIHRIYKGNSIKYIHGRGQVYYSIDKKPLKIIGTGQDITELKMIELELENQLMEKELLLQEIHHRVKNNLQIILSLFDLQAGYHEGNLTEFVENTKARIHAMALVHEKLYTKDTIRLIDARDYILDLLQIIKTIHKDSTDDFDFVTDIENCNLTEDNAFAIGLIVNEAITNSIKHGFPESHSGTIGIKLETLSKRNVLTIYDTGIGFDIDKIQKSMGMKMIQALTTQINATLAFNNIGGTQIVLTFPKTYGKSLN